MPHPRARYGSATVATAQMIVREPTKRRFQVADAAARMESTE